MCVCVCVCVCVCPYVCVCVCVCIGDHVYQPFEPELPWDQFSVPVPESDIPTLHDRLAAVTATNLTRLQRTLHCAAQHLLWSSITGGMMGETGAHRMI